MYVYLDFNPFQLIDYSTLFYLSQAEELPDQFPYFIMTAMGFTRSQWPATRASAILLIGELLYLGTYTVNHP